MEPEDRLANALDLLERIKPQDIPNHVPRLRALLAGGLKITPGAMRRRSVTFHVNEHVASFTVRHEDDDTISLTSDVPLVIRRLAHGTTAGDLLPDPSATWVLVSHDKESDTWGSAPFLAYPEAIAAAEDFSTGRDYTVVWGNPAEVTGLVERAANREPVPEFSRETAAMLRALRDGDTDLSFPPYAREHIAALRASLRADWDAWAHAPSGEGEPINDTDDTATAVAARVRNARADLARTVRLAAEHTAPDPIGDARVTGILADLFTSVGRVEHRLAALSDGLRHPLVRMEDGRVLPLIQTGVHRFQPFPSASATTTDTAQASESGPQEGQNRPLSANAALDALTGPHALTEAEAALSALIGKAFADSVTPELDEQVATVLVAARRAVRERFVLQGRSERITTERALLEAVFSAQARHAVHAVFGADEHAVDKMLYRLRDVLLHEIWSAS